MKYLIKLLQHYGRDWTRTNGVSNVTVLRTACFSQFAYLPIWLQGRDSNPQLTVYETGILPFDDPAVLCPKVGAGVEERV